MKPWHQLTEEQRKAIQSMHPTPDRFAFLMQPGPIKFEDMPAPPHMNVVAAYYTAVRQATGQHNNWRHMSEAPRTGEHILIMTRTHGIMECWFAPGEWSEETPEHPPEYSGPVWVLGDDLTQLEVEENPQGYYDNGCLCWMPCIPRDKY